MANAYLYLEYRTPMSNRCQALSPIFRATIEAIEQQIHDAILNGTPLVAEDLDLRARILPEQPPITGSDSSSSDPEARPDGNDFLIPSYKAPYLAGIIKLCIAGLMTVEGLNVDILTSKILHTICTEMLFADLSPLLFLDHTRLIFRRTAYPKPIILMLQAITRAALRNFSEMDVPWSVYISRYYLDIVDLWLNHPDAAVSDTAAELLTVFISRGRGRGLREFRDMLHQLVLRRPDGDESNDLFDFVLANTPLGTVCPPTGKVPERPLMNTKPPGHVLIPGCQYQMAYGPLWYPAVYYKLYFSTTSLDNPVESLERILNILTKLIPGDPKLLSTCDLLTLLLSTEHPTEPTIPFRARVLASLLYSLYTTPQRERSTGPLLATIDSLVADKKIPSRHSVAQAVPTIFSHRRPGIPETTIREFTAWIDELLCPVGSSSPSSSPN